MEKRTTIRSVDEYAKARQSFLVLRVSQTFCTEYLDVVSRWTNVLSTILRWGYEHYQLSNPPAYVEQGLIPNHEL